MSKNIKNDFLIEITEKDLRNHLLSYSPNPQVCHTTIYYFVPTMLSSDPIVLGYVERLSEERNSFPCWMFDCLELCWPVCYDI